MNNLLYHCPKCGREAKLFKFSDRDYTIVGCDSCDVMLDLHFETDEDAIGAWNERIEFPAKLTQEQMDALTNLIHLYDVLLSTKNDAILARAANSVEILRSFVIRIDYQ